MSTTTRTVDLDAVTRAVRAERVARRRRRNRRLLLVVLHLADIVVPAWALMILFGVLRADWWPAWPTIAFGPALLIFGLLRGVWYGLTFRPGSD